MNLQFQSPIYGSRTIINFLIILNFTAVSIPYLRVTHGRDFCIRSLMTTVSIPYLRVTHEEPAKEGPGRVNGFQSPIYGSRTEYKGFYTVEFSKFQSPIYGSRTIATGFKLHRVGRFQSPIYGSRTWRCTWDYKEVICFNPLSTGHAPISSPLRWSTKKGFNPLSTGHARGKAEKPSPATSVSIPYLRVTHVAGDLP